MKGVVPPEDKISPRTFVGRSIHAVLVSVWPWLRKQSSKPFDVVPDKFVLSTEFAGNPVKLAAVKPFTSNVMSSKSKLPGHVSPSRAVIRAYPSAIPPPKYSEQLTIPQFRFWVGPN